MIDRQYKLSVVRQAKLLGLSRSIVYYLPRAVSDGDMALMRRIDELYLDYPFAGSRMLQGLFRGEGLENGLRHVATLMKKKRVEAIYRRPNTSKPAHGHKIYPYLLRKLAVTRPNQVWAMDLTFVPMARGFVYLCAGLVQSEGSVLAAVDHDGGSLLHRSSRGSAGPSWQTRHMQYGPGIAVHLGGLHGGAEEGGNRHLNGWQGCLAGQCVRHKTVSGARAGIRRNLTFYNSRRPHSSLDRQTPDQAYFNALAPRMVAA